MPSMHINSFKPVLIDKTKPYKDRFRIQHDRTTVKISKEKKIHKRYEIRDMKERNAQIIREEKIVLKENNERWKLLNIVS